MPAVYITRKSYIKEFIKNILRPVTAIVIKSVWRWIPRSAYLGRSPMRLVLAITRKCNANCVFCAYQFAREEDKVHMSDSLF